ncbi:hypothetical protein RCM28_05660 [Escherichia marmotae]|nr:hypothetical protein [Escherichia marmotae]
MMPEICQVPHLPDILPIHHRAPDLMIGDAFITHPMSINQRAAALRQRFALSSHPAIASFSISGVNLFLLKT